MPSLDALSTTITHVPVRAASLDEREQDLEEWPRVPVHRHDSHLAGPNPASLLRARRRASGIAVDHSVARSSDAHTQALADAPGEPFRVANASQSVHYAATR